MEKDWLPVILHNIDRDGEMEREKDQGTAMDEFIMNYLIFIYVF